MSSYNPGRGSMHGTHYEYDIHVPLVFWGAVKAGASDAAATPYDLAPTLGRVARRRAARRGRQADRPAAVTDGAPGPPRKRRPRYAGTHPRRFEEKYKERDAERFPDERAKVLASGKTPAGSHVPVLVAEVLEALASGAGRRRGRRDARVRRPRGGDPEADPPRRPPPRAGRGLRSSCRRRRRGSRGEPRSSARRAR